MAFLRLFAGDLANQFHFGVLCLAALGYAWQWRRWGWRWGLGLTGCYLSANVVLLAFFKVPFNDVWKAAFENYPVVSYGIAALWAGAGLELCLKWLASPRLRAGLASALAIAGIGLTLHGNWQVNDLREECFSDRIGRTILESLPPHCLFIPNEHFDICTTIYLHRIEGVRPDLDMLKESNFLFPAWNFHQGKPKDIISYQDRVSAFLLHETRPVYYSGYLPHPYGIREFGLYRQVMKSMPRSMVMTTVTPSMLRLAEWLANKPPSAMDWVRLWEDQVLATSSALLVRARGNLKDPAMQARYDAVIAAAGKSPFGKVQIASALLVTHHPREALDTATAAIVSMRSGGNSTSYLYEAYRVQAEAHEALGDLNSAIASMEAGVDCNYAQLPGAGIQYLLTLYAQTGRIEPYKKMRQMLKDRGELDAWIRPLDARIGYREE